MQPTLLADVVAVSAAVAATPARKAKIGHLAELLSRLGFDEVEPVVGFLTGEPRQGRIGVGWATLSGLISSGHLAPLDRGSAPEPSLTVADLDRAISELDETRGARSALARRDRLVSLLGAATPAEGEFIWRLLTGELRQGALAGLMADAVAGAAGIPAAVVRRACMLAGDLGVTAALALTGGRDALEAVGLEVMRPIQPMLASSAADVAEAIGALGESSVEWKLDGIRIQVHRSGDEVAVFTRNLNDITDRLPDVVAVARSLDVDSVVLDGEALDLVARFFDCLYLDGDDLLDRPLRERLSVLETVAGPWRIPGTITADPAEGRAVLVEALAARHEGVVVKAAGSAYEAGRRGKSWRKVKEAVTFDLVILAAEWGHGRRQGWLSNLHLGARDPAGGPFVMVGKTFKGLTDSLLTWQTEEFLARETHRSGITVHVRPELVVEIALDGVQVSTRYPGGVALRFARVKRYRPDKDPTEADTIDAIRALLPPSGG